MGRSTLVFRLQKFDPETGLSNEGSRRWNSAGCHDEHCHLQYFGDKLLNFPKILGKLYVPKHVAVVNTMYSFYLNVRTLLIFFP